MLYTCTPLLISRTQLKFLLAISLLVLAVVEALLGQIFTFRYKRIFGDNILAEIEGWESDNITDLESLFLHVVGDSEWSASWVTRDPPGLSEESAGDDPLAGPALLVIALV